jgi:four helix bundle protein
MHYKNRRGKPSCENVRVVRVVDDGMSRAPTPCTMGAKRVEDLDVWQLCEEIRVLVLAGTESAPARKDYKFCDQILDASEDAVSDISEGFGRFRPREFAQFLGYAITSTAEVLERTRFAHDRKYFDDQTSARLVVLCIRADRALRSFRKYLWSVDPSDVPYHPDNQPKRQRKRRQRQRRESEVPPRREEQPLSQEPPRSDEPGEPS